MAAQSQRGYNYLVKLLLIGDSAVGKSSLLLRFSDASFSSSFITTIGIDFQIKSIEIDGLKVKLQIWDTAGQERFKTITTAYYRGAMGILLVYDVSSRATFDHVKDWIRQIEQHAEENVNKILVGNKSDVPAEMRQVTYEEGKALAAEYNLPFYETSAKADLEVTEAFEGITKDVVDRLGKEGARRGPKPGINLPRDKPDGNKKKACC